MTRINIVNPAILLDEHLRAEYREITRLWSIEPGQDRPGYYKLGKGHVKFFLDKGTFITKRCEDLTNEIKKRGFTTKEFLPWPWEFNDYKVTDSDIALLRDRLLVRIPKKPHYYGSPLTQDEARRHYLKLMKLKKKKEKST